MHTIKLFAGDHISAAATRLAAAATDHGEATMTFNDIVLTAKSGDAARAIEDAYDKACNARHEAYVNSPEGQAHAKKRDAEIAQLQEKHDCLLRDLASLDFTDDVAVLDWLCAMQPASDHVGVVVRKADIIAAFKAAGFESNVNVGANYREDDRENSFRYLVGQGLGTLQACAIHGILHDFVKRWKERFGVC